VNYTTIETDIVTRLAPLVTAGYQVEAMPDNEAANLPPRQRGRVTVQVGMSKFGEHRSITAAVVQEEDIYVDIILRARTLRATGGIYDLCELARRLLIGFTPQNCRLPLAGVDFGGINPAELQDSIWTYSLRLKTQTISVGAADEDVTPLITAITMDGQTTTAPPPSAELFASAYLVESSGDSVILAWITSGGSEVSISGIGVVDAIGSATVSVTGDVTYTLTLTQGVTVLTQSVTLGIVVPAPPATITINSAPFASVPSGDTLDVPVVNGGSNPVGSEQGGEWVIGNSEVFINAVQVADIVAEDTANLAVELDGVPSGAWNAGTQTWEVSSLPCPDGSVTVNAVAFGNAPSGGSLNVPVKNSAGTLRGSKVGADWVVPDGSVPVTNTANTPITTIAVPSGNSVPYVIPNVAWTDSDGSAESTPYGDGIVCTPQVQSLTIRVQVALAADAFTFTATANEAGSITNINAGGLAAFVLSKNASPVTAPFTIANGDVISAAFTAAGAATTVILTGTY
jgi:hypothetical protein